MDTLSPAVKDNRPNRRCRATVRLLLTIVFLSVATASASPADTLHLTLSEALRIAISESPDAGSAVVTKSEGTTTLVRGIAGLLPTASGSVTYSVTGGSAESIATKQWTSALTINQVIFSPSVFTGVVTSAIRSSYSQTSARDQFARLAYDVTVAYLGLLTAGKLDESARSAVTRAAANLAVTQEKNRLGMVSTVDLLRVQVQESQARLSVIGADRALAAAQAGFRATVGLDRSVAVVATEPLEAPSGFAINDPDSLIRVIERTNPGIRMAAQQKAIATAGVVAAVGDILPVAGAYWSAGKTDPALGPVITDWKSASTSYGVRVSFPLVDIKGYVLDAVDAANASRRARINARATALQLDATAIDAVDGYIEARAAYEQAVVNLELSQRLRDLAAEEIRLGAISQVDYLQADADLVQAQSSLISATSDTYIQAARITYLQGRMPAN